MFFFLFFFFYKVDHKRSWLNVNEWNGFDNEKENSIAKDEEYVYGILSKKRKISFGIWACFEREDEESGNVDYFLVLWKKL